MPTYEYQCPEGHQFERFQKISEKPRAKCPTCGRMATRKISAGAGLVFKGSGFYITDYGKGGKGVAKEPSKTEGGEKAGTKSDQKPDAPTDSHASGEDKPVSKPGGDKGEGKAAK
ncbi:MAG TPA: zinc ribbon domain-containing protein [Gemmatimonadales bacterium]|jgi:putative FmdB family regulatory protein